MPDRRTFLFKPRLPRARWFVAFALLLLTTILTVRIAVDQTDLVPVLVDTVRNLPFVGPDRMAALEDAYYNVQDQWNQFVYDRTHSPIVTSEVVGAEITPPADGAVPVSNPAPATAGTPNAAVDSSAGPPDPALTLLPGADLTPLPTATPGLLMPGLPAPIRPIILSDPQQGEGVWTTARMPLAGSSRPPLMQTFYRPDPERPFARVDLVWIDLSQTRLNLVAGTVEPRSTTGFRGDGIIPPDVQKSGNLLAAWNGGFLTIHGAYGMMVDRRLIAPARDGFAVLAQFADGSMHIGVWGRDIKMSPNLVSFRQNGPILIDRGRLNENGLLAWGKSISGETRIWRSGIGFTADGGLVYAAGNSLNAQALGQALQAAGAVEAMQLDVNAWHVFFYTYQLAANALLPTKLNTGMPGGTRMYLTPYDRDFMYLVAKQGMAGLAPQQIAPLPTLQGTLAAPTTVAGAAATTPNPAKITPYFTP